MSIARSNIIVGPAKIAFNSATFFHNGDITLRHRPETFRIQPSGFTQADVRDNDRMIECDITPDGRWDANVIAAFWPHFNAVPGKSMATGTDLPLVITDANSHVHTIKSAIVTKAPDLILSAERSALGSASFMGIVPDNVDPDDADAYHTYATSAGTFADSGFTLGAIKTQPYTAVWTGITGFSSAFVSIDGFTCSTEYQYTPFKIDGLGTVDLRLTGVRFTVRAKPIGISKANILAAARLAGSGTALGSSRQATSAALTITGADGVNWVTVDKAALVNGDEYVYSSSAHRQGDLVWEALMDLSSGAQNANVVLAAS
jgi:hypothetical protein